MLKQWLKRITLRRHFPLNRFADLDWGKLMRDARFQAADERGMTGFDYTGQNWDFSVSYPQEWAAEPLPEIVRDVLAHLNELDNAVQAFLQRRAMQSAGNWRGLLFTLGVVWFERDGMIILDYWVDAANS